MAFLASCAPRQAVPLPGEFTRQGDTIHMQPYLTAGALGRLKAMWAPEVKRVKVQGNQASLSEEYLQMGEFLVAQKLANQKVEVQVSGLCVGGCAQFLALPASTLSFDAGGLLGFQGLLSKLNKTVYQESMQKLGYTNLEQQLWLAYIEKLQQGEDRLLTPRQKALLTDADLLTTAYRKSMNVPKDTSLYWTPGASELVCRGLKVSTENFYAGPYAEQRAELAKQRLVFFTTAELPQKPEGVSSCVF